MFHRQFPELKISGTLLDRTYKQHGVKFKFIRLGKKIIDFDDPQLMRLFTDMFHAVKATRLSDKKLVLINEAVFTFNTFRKRAWPERNDSIRV